MKKSDLISAFDSAPMMPEGLFTSIESGIHAHVRKQRMLKAISIAAILCVTSAAFLLVSPNKTSNIASLEVIDDMHSFFASDTLLDESSYYAFVDETIF